PSTYPLSLHDALPILERVGADLVDQPDAPPLLPEVEQEPLLHRRQRNQRRLQLVAAIAAEGSHHVAGEALRMETDRKVRRSHHLAMDHRQVLLPVAVV